VLLDETELAAIQEIARERGMTVAEWVRGALRRASRNEPRGDVAKKLQAVRLASRYSFPSGDVQDMLAEIEAGYEGKQR
jgi:hypothetical protein